MKCVQCCHITCPHVMQAFPYTIHSAYDLVKQAWLVPVSAVAVYVTVGKGAPRVYRRWEQCVYKVKTWKVPHLATEIQTHSAIKSENFIEPGEIRVHLLHLRDQDTFYNFLDYFYSKLSLAFKYRNCIIVRTSTTLYHIAITNCDIFIMP
jgi:hypothetical protein